MYGYAEYAILSSVVAAVFTAVTTAALFGAKSGVAASVFVPAIALTRGIELAFSPHGTNLVYFASILLLSAIVARRGGAKRYACACVCAAIAFAVSRALDDVLFDASRGAPFLCPFALAAVLLVLHVAIVAAAAKLCACRTRRAYGAEAELTVGGKRVVAAAFWDSGNRLTFRGLSPVIVLGGRLSAVLDGARVAGAIGVSSACGECGKIAYYLDELKVRDGDGEVKYTDVVAIAADRQFDGFEVLLNCGLR